MVSPRYVLSAALARLHISGLSRSWLVAAFLGLLLLTPARAVPPSGQFVAVGEGGLILTSADGATWSSRTSGTALRLRGAAAKTGTLIAVGESGTVLSSLDGITWSAVSAGISETLRGVAASSSRFVTVGGQTAGLAFYSDDGATWSAASVPSVGKLRGTAANGSVFVAVGAAGTILSSADGAVWTARVSNTTEQLDGVVWTGTEFHAISSSGQYSRSTDGITWEAPAVTSAPSWIESLAWNATRVVTVGSGGRIRTSDDAQAWTQRVSGVSTVIHGVAWCGTFAPQSFAPATLFANLRKLTVSGVTATGHAYDGTTTATVDVTSAALVGVFAGDTVNLDTTGATGAFATAAAGVAKTVTVSGLALSGTNASDYTLTQPAPTADITRKALTVSGVTASNRAYNGGTSATPGFGSAALAGVVGSDNVTLNSASATASFGTAGVGSGKTVTLAGLSLDGTAAGNYLLTQPATTADITAKGLTVTGVTASNKAYDGSATATPSFTGASLVGVVGSENVTLNSASATGTFSSAAVGSGKTVTIASLALSGTDAGNYSLTQPTTTADITAKALTVSGVTASHKTYDGSTSATPSFGSASLVGIVGSDAVTLNSASATAAFSSSSVGSGKTVTVAGLSLNGANAGLYTVTQPTTTANITAKTLTVSGATVANKVYDGTTAATPGFGSATLVGVVGADGVTLVSGSATAAFATAAVGSGKGVTISGLTLGGAQAANYTLTQPAGTADITVKALVLSGVTASSKVYDGGTTTSLSFVGSSLIGVVGAEVVTVERSAAYGTFASKTVGSGKTVTAVGVSLAGADASNYSLIPPVLTADIRSRPVTVSGLRVATRAYDGGTAASLEATGFYLAGAVAGDVVTLSTAAASATFADANAGVGKPVSVSGIGLSGADAGNYQLLALGGVTGTITPAAATLTLAGLQQTYDGRPRTISVSAAGTQGASVRILYAGSEIAPTNAGSYPVRAEVQGGNVTGAAEGTLVVAKAAQTVTLSLPATGTTGAAVPLSARSSLDLPVTLAVVSGSGRIASGQLVIVAPGPIVVRASQAGSDNVLAATAEATLVAGGGKGTQAIDFPRVEAQPSNASPVGLRASASSGLPVSYTLVSGPAVLSGSTLRLTGAVGTVTVRASQAGDERFLPADDVSVSFPVIAATTNVYFGFVSRVGAVVEASVGNVAVAVNPASNQGSLLIVAPTAGLNRALDFTVRPDGTFEAVFTVEGVGPVLEAGAPPVAAAATTVTLRGRIVDGRFVGTLEPLGLSISAPVQSPTGASAAVAGFYRSSTLDASAGATYSVVGTNNEVLVLASTPAVTTGGLTTLNAGGGFTLQSTTASGAATIRGSVDAPSTTVQGSISVGSQTTSYAGLLSTTTRTDRMINLSSRVRISGPNAVLITGFVVGGTSPKQVLVRGIGPALTSFGVPGALANPRLRVYRGSEIVAENDDWNAADADVFARLGAFALPAGSRDAAAVLTLAPGTYTVHISDGGQSGVVMAEIYDANTSPGSEYQRLINISTRGEVSPGDGILIGGFVVTGNTPKRLLVRGVGSALAAYGVQGALADPRLRVYRGSEVVAENDNWSAVAADSAALAAASRDTGAFPLTAGSRDAAVIVTLAPGAYTAQVSPADGVSSGAALVEIYELP